MLPKRRYKGEEEDEELSVYSIDALEHLLDDDELSPYEEAFMAGYDDA